MTHISCVLVYIYIEMGRGCMRLCDASADFGCGDCSPATTTSTTSTTTTTTSTTSEYRDRVDMNQ